MEKDDIKIVRRNRVNKKKKKATRTDSNEPAMFSINTAIGQFHFYAHTVRVLGIGVGDAVMFGFNSKKKVGYIYKEEPDIDNYVIGKIGDPSHAALSFTSKNLYQYIDEFFDIAESGRIYFLLSEKPNEKGWWSFTPERNVDSYIKYLKKQNTSSTKKK